MRGALLLVALTLLAPLASAQFGQTVVMPGRAEAMPSGGDQIFVQLTIDARASSKFQQPPVMPWLVAGHDNVLNLSLTNGRSTWVNATFRFNATGATVTPDEVVLSVPPYGVGAASVAAHPDETGEVEIHTAAIDAFQTSGEPLEASLLAPALVLPSMRFLDPPTENASSNDGFTRLDSYGREPTSSSAYLRVAPGRSIVPRIELANPYETALPAFTLTLRIPGLATPAVDVPALDAHATYVAEFPEYTPVETSFGPSFGGPMGSFTLQPIALVEIGGQTFEAGGASFRVERGAILEYAPISALIEVQNGLAIDLYIPTDPTLGAPARIKYNLTNLGTTRASGPLVITVMTPYRIFYEVQGPETYTVQVDVPPGEKRSGAIDFTPRVTGAWSVTTYYTSSDQPFGYGSGGGFEVRGPVVIAFDQNMQTETRIREPLEIDVSLATTDTISDAQLRIGSGSNYYREPSAGSSGSDYRAGFADTLIESRTPSATLGTLRPGGVVNTTIEVIGRGSGTYTIVPYVLAEGFAYTSTVPYDPATRVPIDVGIPYGNPMLNFIVHTRAVPTGLSLMPLTLGLAFFVGVWTMRTRFVR